MRGRAGGPGRADIGLTPSAFESITFYLLNKSCKIAKDCEGLNAEGDRTAVTPVAAWNSTWEL